jgi:hypothetical protein
MKISKYTMFLALAFTISSQVHAVQVRGYDANSQTEITTHDVVCTQNLRSKDGGYSQCVDNISGAFGGHVVSLHAVVNGSPDPLIPGGEIDPTSSQTYLQGLKDVNKGTAATSYFKADLTGVAPGGGVHQ